MTSLGLLLSGVGLAQAPLRCQLRVLNLTANGGINPATAIPWKAGDKYRLAFVTSAATPASSTNIATYNTFVQNAANSGTTFPSLRTVSWKAICSTASVNANTNTATVSGTGEAIFLMNGSTVIANNYADLWDGTLAANITRDENNAIRSGSSVWTGTINNGTKDSRPNGALGTGTPATGSYGQATTKWVSDGIRASNAFSYPMYALSEPLTIIGMSPSPDIGASVPAGNLTLSWTNLLPTTGTDVWVDVWFGTNPANLTKVAAVQQNLTSFVVNLPGSNTYYWRIDSYLDGTPTGTPEQSVVFRFLVFDSDLDGFPDDYEQLHTNPQSPTALNREDDRDQDGLTNWVEFGQATSPSDPDSDGDGLLDGSSTTVTSADARYTAWVADGILFSDDGNNRTFRSELAVGTNPLKADTDGDTLADGVESNTGTFVSATNTGTNPLNADTDADGLKDGVETRTGAFVNTSNTGTNPHLADTDNDGARDWYEVAIIDKNPALGSPPNSPNSSSLKPSISYPLPAYDGSSGVTNKPVKVYIMSGQSNMLGYGTVNGNGTGILNTMVNSENKFPHLRASGGGWVERNDVHVHALIDTPNNGFQKAKLRPDWAAGTARFGPELGFGTIMGWLHDEPVLLIKPSIGNRALGWDYLPPGTPDYQPTPADGFVYAGYGKSGPGVNASGQAQAFFNEAWSVGKGPGLIGWYAGKQFDDYYHDEEDMGMRAWVTGVSYPANCEVKHNGLPYISIAANTSGALNEPGVGANWTTAWRLYTVTNVADILDNFASQYPAWATQGFEISGYVWWQGHRDQSNGAVNSNRYRANMERFIKQIRLYYENRYGGGGEDLTRVKTNAPFVLATLDAGGWDMTGNALTVANGQLAVDGNAKTGGVTNYPEFTGNVKTVEARGFFRPTGPDLDGVHYFHNAEAYLLTGDALGRAMVDLQSTTGGNTFASWIATFPSVPPGLSGFSQDADGDGIENGVENYFGSNPSIGSSGLVASATGGSTFTFTHPQNATPASGVTAAYRWSKDLVTFRNHGQSDGTTTVNFNTVTTAGITTVTATVSGTSTAKLFVDVQVIQN